MTTTMEELTYEWPPHVGHYEARLAGFTIVEAVVGAMGFLMVVAVGGHVMVALMVGAVSLLFVRKLERLGGVSLPIYLFYRLQAAYSQETLELPLITAQTHSGMVVSESWDGNTVAIIE
jgi:hypothetical protein